MPRQWWKIPRNVVKKLLRTGGYFRAALKYLLLTGLMTHGGSLATQAAGRQAMTFVIVHGGFGGGYDWKTVDALLTARGHKVYRPTLTGLGERAHLASPAVNLTTHIQDIVNVIKYEGLSNVVLVGHSYGGMVITGVMDKVPERLKHVIFLDAAVPNDGESFITLWENLGMPLMKNETPVNGFWIPSFINLNKPPPSEVPQSWNTFSEPVSFKNPLAKMVPTTFVGFVDKMGLLELEKDEKALNLQNQVLRRISERGWKYEELQSDHLANRTHPKELSKLLERVPVGRQVNVHK